MIFYKRSSLQLIIVLLISSLLSFLNTKSFAQETLRKKIGQMLIFGFTGLNITDTTASMDSLKIDIRDRNISGVLEFANNLSNPLQMKKLNDELRKLATIPLFIATDQEGGSVARLGRSNGFQKTSTAFTLGTTWDNEDSTRSTARLMASWFEQTRINLNFAPVTDVNVNPKSPAIGALQRSYSSLPSKVSEHAWYFIDEFHKKNFITTIKHFPGHGSAATDSHKGLTDITNTWADSELVPYREMFSRGFNDMVMVGHLYNAKIDTFPATLSYKAVTGLLRQQLGYNGVVITDEMSMGAISNNYGEYQAAVLAINAGVDILLYNINYLNGSSRVRQLVDYIESKVNDGTIPLTRIDESYNRIMDLKNRYFITSGLDLIASAKPEGYQLNVYPNPFNASTRIRIAIPASGESSLKIYDILGREVISLFHEEMSAGTYNYEWNAGDFPSGVYIARLQTGGFSKSSKIVLMK